MPGVNTHIQWHKYQPPSHTTYIRSSRSGDVSVYGRTNGQSAGKALYMVAARYLYACAVRRSSAGRAKLTILPRLSVRNLTVSAERLRQHHAAVGYEAASVYGSDKTRTDNHPGAFSRSLAHSRMKSLDHFTISVARRTTLFLATCDVVDRKAVCCYTSPSNQFAPSGPRTNHGKLNFVYRSSSLILAYVI